MIDAVATNCEILQVDTMEKIVLRNCRGEVDWLLDGATLPMKAGPARVKDTDASFEPK